MKQVLGGLVSYVNIVCGHQINGKLGRGIMNPAETELNTEHKLMEN